MNSTIYLTFVFVQAADHLDDEDDLEDEETALENFTTAVDNEETDEYIAFWNSMQGFYGVVCGIRLRSLIQRLQSLKGF